MKISQPSKLSCSMLVLQEFCFVNVFEHNLNELAYKTSVRNANQVINPTH